MKTSDLAKGLADGACLVVLEYRAFTVDEKQVTSKKTQRKELRIVSTHACEMMNGTPVRIDEWHEDGTHRDSLKAKFAKGERVVLRVEEFVSESYGALIKARGQLQRLEA